MKYDFGNLTIDEYIIKSSFELLEKEYLSNNFKLQQTQFGVTDNHMYTFIWLGTKRSLKYRITMTTSMSLSLYSLNINYIEEKNNE